MRNALIPAALAVAMVVLPASALANAIQSSPTPALPSFNGQISMTGGATYSNTGINFNENANIIENTAYGSFSPSFSSGCSACLTMNNILLTGYVPETVYSATMNGETTSFYLQSFSYSENNNNFSLDGMGYATLTGYANSPGFFTLTSQGGRNMNVSFSATTDVPEPGSLLLLGTGLFGMGLLARKRRNKATR